MIKEQQQAVEQPVKEENKNLDSHNSVDEENSVVIQPPKTEKHSAKVQKFETAQNMQIGSSFAKKT